jgi:aspartate kinase
MNDSSEMGSAAIRSATLKTDVRRVTLHGVPHTPGVAARIFQQISSRNINVEDIIATTSEAGRDVIVSFTVDELQSEAAREIAEQVAQRFGDTSVEFSSKLARLRMVGMGMRAQSGVAAKVFDALAAEGINIEDVSTSEIVISVLVPEPDGERALEAIFKAFNLERPPE